jgi:hypothetical protein
LCMLLLAVVTNFTLIPEWTSVLERYSAGLTCPQFPQGS